jgi:hypothetical protein
MIARLVWQPDDQDAPEALTADIPADQLAEMRSLIGTDQWASSEAVMWINCRAGDEPMAKRLFRLARITSLEPAN